MKTYIYPQNLKANLQTVALEYSGLSDDLSRTDSVSSNFNAAMDVSAFAITAVFAFLSIRLEETTVIDYMVCAFRFFVTAQQLFYWK